MNTPPTTPMRPAYAPSALLMPPAFVMQPRPVAVANVIAGHLPGFLQAMAADPDNNADTVNISSDTDDEP